MKYAIIENEAYALEHLKRVVSSLRTEYELVFTAESVEECINYFGQQHSVDIIFMDIELVDGNCFDIFRAINIKTPIIFTTAYDAYAIQAFKVNSIDYLLKPIADKDVEAAIRKFETHYIKTNKTPDYKQLYPFIHKNLARRRILVNSGDTYSYIQTDEIAFFVSEDKYVYATLKNGRRRMTDFQNLSEVEAEVDGSDFFQLSRNLIASISAIGKVSKFFTGRLKVEIEAGEEKQEVVVSAARKKLFLDWLGGK